MSYWWWMIELIITGTFIKLFPDAVAEFHPLCARQSVSSEVKLLFCFPLKASHCDRSLNSRVLGHLTSDKNNLKMDKHPFRENCCSDFVTMSVLIRQIELLSFLLTAHNKQPNSWCILSDKAIYFLSAEIGNTHSGNWTANEEWKIQTSSPLHHHLYKP